MKLIAAPARLSTASANFEAEFKARLHWSAETDAHIEARVADILTDVRVRGDAALLEYTARFDGLDAASMAQLELSQAELKAAFEALPAAQRAALESAAGRVRSYHEAQKQANGQSWSYRDADGTLLGQKVTPLDRVGIYVPGGKAAYPSSVLMNAIPAHVAGVGEIIMVVPTPERREEPAGAGGRLAGRRDARLHPRRRAGGGGAGLGHRHGAGGRQDHRPRQRLRGGGQAPRVRHRGHRHDCRPERDPGAGRRQHAAGLGGDGPVFAGRARRAGAKHPAVPRRRLHRARAAGHRPAAAGDAARRDHRRLAQRPRRADPHPQHGRGLRHQQPHRARAPGGVEPRAAPLGAAAQARRRDLPGRLHQREPGRLLRRAEPRAADLAAPRAFPRRWGCTTSRSAAA